eukprot:CAMPEP_0184012840 /NCGR_PEP_ID=MMETSP0954-20121128/4667_1 /TAXON_ID=627963 /ORGANISM="Aplanochytrium sp, Strain PBS07" /LENGTH=688 /DNA_ID=CAMNT_0026292935 /DNA_START=101 /DNA_END=2167 /DNA_ORIENTATION=+
MSFGKPNIVILGAGYAGVHCAKKLVKTTKAKDCNIILIETRHASVHKFAGARAVVKGDRFAYRVAIPNLAVIPEGRGTVLHRKIVRVDPQNKSVVTDGGENIPYDILVCATGARSVSPCEPPLEITGTKEMVKWFRKTSEVIAKNKHITILGGGAVGTELAGEIKYQYPNKKVSIINNTPTLIANCTPKLNKKFNKKLEQKLDKMGIRLFLGQKPTNLKLADFDNQPFIAGKILVRTNAGSEIKSDVVLLCTGKLQNNSMYPQQWLNEIGQIKVTENLHLWNDTAVFAAGDINDVNETKQGYWAGKQGDKVAQNIKRLLKSKRKLKKYKPTKKTIILVPLGKKVGITNYGNKVLGNRATRNIKGKNVFVKDTWKLFNMKKLLIKEDEPNWKSIALNTYPKPGPATMDPSVAGGNMGSPGMRMPPNGAQPSNNLLSPSPGKGIQQQQQQQRQPQLSPNFGALNPSPTSSEPRRMKEPSKKYGYLPPAGRVTMAPNLEGNTSTYFDVPPVQVNHFEINQTQPEFMASSAKKRRLPRLRAPKLRIPFRKRKDKNRYDQTDSGNEYTGNMGDMNGFQNNYENEKPKKRRLPKIGLPKIRAPRIPRPKIGVPKLPSRGRVRRQNGKNNFGSDVSFQQYGSDGSPPAPFSKPASFADSYEGGQTQYDQMYAGGAGGGMGFSNGPPGAGGPRRGR